MPSVSGTTDMYLETALNIHRAETSIQFKAAVKIFGHRSRVRIARLSQWQNLGKAVGRRIAV